ncbi:hypothetical protein [Methylomicrobium lacus]|uniref:hypothetical protein n=1 Tax=Methylomicrobium lacus TaxID=136992 RepID=UPI0004B8D4F1|nr:hypothetical protein [Methylomicrobium lacus]
MQDPYTGQAGTFVVDPDKGERVPIEQWQAEQAAKAQAAKPKAKTETQAETN